MSFPFIVQLEVPNSLILNKVGICPACVPTALLPTTLLHFWYSINIECFIHQINMIPQRNLSFCVGQSHAHAVVYISVPPNRNANRMRDSPSLHDILRKFHHVARVVGVVLGYMCF